MPDDILDDWEPGPPSLFMRVFEARAQLDKVLDAIDHGDNPERIAAMIHQVVKLLQQALTP